MACGLSKVNCGSSVPLIASARGMSETVSPQVLRDAASGGRANLRADRLDRGQQRVAEQHCPGQAIAELRADLAIGADAARIVVGRAGDETGTEHVEKSAALRRLIII